MVYTLPQCEGLAYRKSEEFSVLFMYFLFIDKHLISSLRVRENGQERTEVEEDGVLKTVLINGNSFFAII